MSLKRLRIMLVGTCGARDIRRIDWDGLGGGGMKRPL